MNDWNKRIDQVDTFRALTTEYLEKIAEFREGVLTDMINDTKGADCDCVGDSLNGLDQSVCALMDVVWLYGTRIGDEVRASIEHDRRHEALASIATQVAIAATDAMPDGEMN